MRLIVALLFATNLMAQNVPNYVPTNGLVGWWPFNGNANDESGNGNNGTVNGPILTNDRFGNSNSAYDFKQGKDLICTKNQYNSLSSISYSIWINTTNEGIALSFNNSQCIHGGTWDRALFILKNEVDFYTYNGSEVFTKSSVNVLDNYWHHIVITMDQSGSIIYIDGNKITTNPNQNKGQNYLGYFRIGGLSPNDLNNSLIGQIDDIGIYNRALTQEEITALYTGTPPCTNPTASITTQSTTTFCQGGSVNLNASTGANYTYEWYNNGNIINGATSSIYNASTSGNYTVKVIDGECNTTSSATVVNVNANPSVSLNSLNAYTLKTSSPIQLVGNPTGGSYGGEGVTGSTFNPTTVALGKKTITYNYTSPQGCSGSDSKTTIVADTVGNVCSVTKYDTITTKITVNDTVGILKISFQLTTGIKANTVTNISVYPNPTSDVLIIDATDSPALAGYTYRILDVQGKQIYNALVTSSKTEIALKTLGAKGVYVLHIVDANGISIENKKIVLQ